MRMPRDRGGAIPVEPFLMLIVSFFWALGHPLGRIILRTLHPFQLASLSLSIGFLGLLIFILLSGKAAGYARLTKGELFLSFFVGIFGFFLYQIFTFSALERIPGSVNAVLVATNVVFITILAWLFLRERIDRVRVLGIGVALTGAVLVTFNRGFSLQGEISLIGCVFSMCAAVSFALYTVIGKKVLNRGDPLLTSSLAILAGSILLTTLTLLTTGYGAVRTADTRTILLVVLLGLTMIGISYPLWFFCLKRVQASRISIFIYLTPVFAVILSYLLLHETLTWLYFAGAALILTGIVVITRRMAR